MSRIKLKKVDQISRKTVSDARDGFLRHCQLKNLAPHTYTYYKENLQFFFDSAPQVKFVDEFNQETIENFIGQLMHKGNRVTAINARLRAAYVFLRYCFEQEYLEAFPLSLIKEDETYKEPYTDSELQKLLKQPQEGTWVEWRNWAVINLLLATGVRANTVVNIKISDVDFEHNIIRLRKLKNRKQQMVPMSTTLNTALSLYLKVWDWGEDDYLFPCNDHQQLKTHSLILSIRKYNLSRGVTKTSVHLFRHTFAKNYILAGGGMIQLQAILGHSTGGNSGAEDRFIELFCDAFGAEKGQFVYLQYPMVDIYGGHRTIDFAVRLPDGLVAIEVDGNTWHQPGKVSQDKYHDDLLKQNSMVFEGWRVFRWTSA